MVSKGVPKIRNSNNQDPDHFVDARKIIFLDLTTYKTYTETHSLIYIPKIPILKSSFASGNLLDMKEDSVTGE